MTPTTFSNLIGHQQKYQNNYRLITGKNNSLATHELHIFMKERDPPLERVDVFFKTVNEWNKKHPDIKLPMEACYLGLTFRNGDGSETIQRIMQSARYLRSNNTDDVIRELYKDAQWFADNDFAVSRVKIEASAYGINGVPKTSGEAPLYPGYFEFHIMIRRKDSKELAITITDEEKSELTAISKKFSSEFKVPFPHSYNIPEDRLHDDGTKAERFIDFRPRGKGIKEMAPILERLKQAINATKTFAHFKTIPEWVYFDSCPSQDQGSIDYTPQEIDSLAD